MPIAYDFLPHLNLLYMAGFGLCTGQAYVEANLAAARDARRRPGQKALLDMRAVTALSISPAEMEAIIEMDRALAAEGSYGLFQTALLARGVEAVETMIGKLYNARVRQERMGVEVFVSLGEALAWLELTKARDEVEQLRNRLGRAA